MINKSIVRTILLDYVRIPLVVQGLIMILNAVEKTEYANDTGFNLFLILIILTVLSSLIPSVYKITNDLLNLEFIKRRLK